MAKTNRLKQSRRKKPSTTSDADADDELDLPTLLASAKTHIDRGSSPELALSFALRALELSPDSLPALELAASIHLELGDTTSAYTVFSRAAALDPTGCISGVSKFLQLAQLHPTGGSASIELYETAINQLRGEIPKSSDAKQMLVAALCGSAELYMSDLCMEPDAESRCERYVSEALLVDPDSSEAWATMASLRVSQTREADAVVAIKRSIESWTTAIPDDYPAEELPSYASRFTAARIAVEVGELPLAIDVCERLREEDDQLPDLWYLAGWAWVLMSEREKEEGKIPAECLSEARGWLKQCDILCEKLGWEDEGIREHTTELLTRISNVLPDVDEDINEDEDNEEEEEEWESEDENGDDVMKDS